MAEIFPDPFRATSHRLVELGLHPPEHFWFGDDRQCVKPVSRMRLAKIFAQPFGEHHRSIFMGTFFPTRSVNSLSSPEVRSIEIRAVGRHLSVFSTPEKVFKLADALKRLFGKNTRFGAVHDCDPSFWHISPLDVIAAKVVLAGPCAGFSPYCRAPELGEAMRPGRELDTKIATEVFGHKVWARGKVLYENPPTGDRPLRNYTREVEWAWRVAEKMKVSLLAIEGGQWFAFVGPENVDGWPAPESMLKILEEKKFDGCGAAVGDNVALVICEAAIHAIEKRKHAPRSE